jgi:hypothetical protein
LDLRQELRIHTGENAGKVCHDRVLLTAELYRVAALLYLYQCGIHSSLSAYPVYLSEMKTLLASGFTILNQNGICTSPWRLFIIATSAYEDEDRIKALEVIEVGVRESKIGNYRIIGSLVESVWKAKDLAADEKE